MSGLTLQVAVERAIFEILAKFNQHALCSMENLDNAVTNGAQLAVMTHVLGATDGNQSKTARILGLNRTTLRTRMRRAWLLPTNGRHA